MSWGGHCHRLWILWASALIAGTQNLICMCEYKIIRNSWFSQQKWADVSVAASLLPDAAECYLSQNTCSFSVIHTSFKILPHLSLPESLPGRRAMHVNRSGAGFRQHWTLLLKIPAAHLRTSVWFPPLLPAQAELKAKVGSWTPVEHPVSRLVVQENPHGAKFRQKPSGSSQPAGMIAVNSLKFLPPLQWAAITLKLSFKPLIMFLREWKETKGAKSSLEIEEDNYPTKAISNLGIQHAGIQCDNVKHNGLFHCLLVTTRPGASQKPGACPQSSPNPMEKRAGRADAGASSCWRPARGGGRGAVAILYNNMTHFVHQSGHFEGNKYCLMWRL